MTNENTQKQFQTTTADATERTTLRLLTTADAASVRRLAERDSADVPSLPLLGAERDGELLAAISLDGSRLIADPFRASAGAAGMLAAELHERTGRDTGGRRRGILGRLLAPRSAQLGASPPGSGRRALQH